MSDDRNGDDATHAPENDPVISSLMAECPELWDVVDQFARGLPGVIEEMASEFRTASSEQRVAWARALSDAGRDHGYSALVDYAAALERTARDGLLDSVEKQLVELRDLARQIHAGIQTADPTDGIS